MKNQFGDPSIRNPSILNAKDKARDAVWRALQERNARSSAAPGLYRRIYATRGKQHLPFEKLIADENRVKVKIAYADLTAEQKQNLVNIMVCEALARFSFPQVTYHFLHIPAPPECYDPTKAVIGIKDNSIYIGPYLDGRIYGLQEIIHSSPPMRDPLRLEVGRY